MAIISQHNGNSEVHNDVEKYIFQLKQSVYQFIKTFVRLKMATKVQLP